MREIHISAKSESRILSLDDRLAKHWLDAITDDPLYLLTPEGRERVLQAWSRAMVSVDGTTAKIVEHYGDDPANWHPDAHERLADAKLDAAVTALGIIRQEFQPETTGGTTGGNTTQEADWTTTQEAGGDDPWRPLGRAELLEGALSDCCDRFLFSLDLSAEDRSIVRARLKHSESQTAPAAEPGKPTRIDRKALYTSWEARQVDRKHGAQKRLCDKLGIYRQDLDKWFKRSVDKKRKREKFPDDGEWARRLVEELKK